MSHKFDIGNSSNAKPKHLIMDAAEFSIFTTDELKKLCVKKITTPLTFDNLGHPIAGGLYDKALGPLNEKGEPCGTCYKNIYHCPGHFGYIELPLPVVNPIFSKMLGIIIKISCLKCYSIQIPSHMKHSLALQLKLLNCGLVTEALEIESKIAEILSIYQSLENVPEEIVLPTSEYDAMADKAFEELNGRIALNRTTEKLRNVFLRDLYQQVKSRRSCMFCKKPIDKIETLRNRIIKVTNLSHQESGTKPKKIVKGGESMFVTPEESKLYVREIWKNDHELLGHLVPILKNIKNADDGNEEAHHPTDVFFFDIIPVSPPNLRPVNFVNGRMAESPQTELYKLIMKDCMMIKIAVQVVKNGGKVEAASLPPEARDVYMYAQGDTALEKLNSAWETLQANVNNIVDRDQGMNKTASQGLKQIIEKKAGIIRKHMMGKRVNFAARSVITPDPNLNVDEIGVPEEFAKRLTYPVPVTSWNVQDLRKMIENGPDVHPGAVMVEFENGSMIRLNPNYPEQISSVLKRLLTPDAELTDRNCTFKGVKLVYRHLLNGDVLLLNRQPTLHKPSIMAHTARILKGEKTLRLHYANCKAYNADFDGDEMNAHFPQNELARSEAYNITNVANQYLVPKDGTPLSGLIQDHVIAGVRLTIRGRFFNKSDYQQLVYQALSSCNTSEIVTLPPSIVKPKELWSGKQILSTIITNVVPRGRALINLKSTSKIPVKAWQVEVAREWRCGDSSFLKIDPSAMTESEVVIRNGELLSGVLDKTHYGATPYGLVHCIYELYGATCAIKFLSALSKVFTYSLQRDGFTLGVRDILVSKDADEKRSQIVDESRRIGHRTITKALDLSIDETPDAIVATIENRSLTNSKLRAIIDREYKNALDSVTNDINKTCLPAGLICKFPSNNLQLMVQSGAKGSTVNTMQISCLLGQIELEGKRPPIMIGGKSLPSFPPFEFSPRAGGFIDGRFMTGIQPQEFFFHCMAGREGLIDTAVKTSRSGYLQRCLIKHLEGLKVDYDMTVRDSDKSVIQFMYGEDGLDIMKAQFLNAKQMKFLLDNYGAIVDDDIIERLKSNMNGQEVEDYQRQLEDSLETIRNGGGNAKHEGRRSPFTLFAAAVKGKLPQADDCEIDEAMGRPRWCMEAVRLWRAAGDQIKNHFKEKCKPLPVPLTSLYRPDVYYGAMNERLTDLFKNYNANKTDVGGDTKKKKRKRNSGHNNDQLADLLKMKSMRSLCEPGEPVGLLAAQSIGEPSTQMTLNTFHFAGRGEMNVTLGIPRLREILMVASKNLKTPSMEIPFLDHVPDLERKAERLRKILTRVVVADVLEKITVTRQLDLTPVRQDRYTLRFHFLPHSLYKHKYHVKPKYVVDFVSKRFFSHLFSAIKKRTRILVHFIENEDVKRTERRRRKDGDEDEEEGDDDGDEEKRGKGKFSGNNDMRMDDDSSDEEPEDDEDAKQSNKYNETHNEQEPDLDDEELLSLDDDGDEEDGDNKKVIKAEIDDDEEGVDHEESEVKAHGQTAKSAYDKNKYSWYELTFAMPVNCEKLDLSATLRNVANKLVLWEVANINRAITYMKDDKLMLRTDGINMAEMFKYADLLDLNRLYSNDIHKIAETYGIEAAQRVIVKEVRDVFNVYGITVDPRHLSLIADYMTFNGSYDALNRTGMQSDPSPLHQMSFESSLKFLKEAIIMGKKDQLRNPSSCLVVGKPCYSGTGSFTLLQNFAPPGTVR